ncbi:hypothetical protein AB0H43_22280 [Hamadaea sp. NPDC050747]|uniref:hypothetical protein n=1 Tax=Hamadaea sp. NPDC050747 TaxID=3155789 RepID=UPI00340BC948
MSISPISPIVPYYAFNQPGEPIELFAGAATIRNQPITARITWECAHELDLNWTITHSTDQWPGHGAIELQVNRPHGSYRVAGSHRGGDHGWLDPISMSRPGAQLRSVTAHWLNLPDLPDDPWSQVANGWRITVAARPDLANILESIDRAHTIALTHSMNLERHDGCLFSVEDVEPVLAALQFGLSFGAGRWVSPTLPVGFDAIGEVVWERWSEDFCTPGSRSFVGEWLNFTREDDVRHLVDACVREFADEWQRTKVWIPAMATAIQANARDLRVEQRIMTLLPGLEMVVHVMLRHDLGLGSSAYGSLGAAEKLRQALDSGTIPTSIDASHYPRLDAYRLDELVATAASSTPFVDGPTLTTRLRNHIIHPTPNPGGTPAQQLRARVRSAATFEAALLSHEYLLLLILKRLRYVGQYRPTAPSRPLADVPWI